MLADMKC